MPLTDLEIKKLNITGKRYSRSDGGGLFITVTASGAKLWHFNFKFMGKEKTLSIGKYPYISLKQAREERNKAKLFLSQGKDPCALKQEEKRRHKKENALLFEYMAKEWFDSKKEKWSLGYRKSIVSYMRSDVFPLIGKKHIIDIKPMDILKLLRIQEKRGAPEAAKKTLQWCNSIFRYAISTGRADINPASELGGTLQTSSSTHYPFLRADELPDFINALLSYKGSPVTKNATLLLMHTALRPCELMGSLWSDIDFDNKLWFITAERMKKRRDHVVPLSKQSVAILKELKKMTQFSKYIFPNRTSLNKHISKGSINIVIRVIGYSGKVCGHGFRHTMSTILHENNFDSRHIELQLAHADKNSIRGTYNHALYLEQRRKMMQWYSNFLEKMTGNEI
ncbi:tyrosine-type recombinase/integrase [Salmonella enterica]|nr:tyrosine-type recombinase/integrase [Salmonella enterica]EKF2443934.1 tyrosine-type recombinase/integrase [Salmonella enterica]